MFRWIIIFALIFTQSVAYAESPRDQKVVEKFGPRRQISDIVYLGLWGAVLGLSTLSFYGRPQDHLTNIPVGFGAGIIVGTIYVTYKVATNPQDLYSLSAPQSDQKIHATEVKLFADTYVPPTPWQWSYRWTF